MTPSTATIVYWFHWPLPLQRFSNDLLRGPRGLSGWILTIAGAEDLAVDVGVGLVVLNRPLQLQDLDLDARGQLLALAAGTPSLQTKTPELPPAVRCFHSSVEDEVLVLAVGAHDPDGLSGADQRAVLHGPGVLGRIDVDPARQVLAVEQVSDLQRILRLRRDIPAQQHRDSSTLAVSSGFVMILPPAPWIYDLRFTIWAPRRIRLVHPANRKS